MSNPMRVVTTRQLARDTAAVLGFVARGNRVLVTTHGVPRAVLQPLDSEVVPFEGLNLVRPRGDDIPIPADIEVDELQLQILNAFDSAGTLTSDAIAQRLEPRRDFSEFIVAMSRAELSRLVTLTMTGYQRTPLGTAVLRHAEEGE